MIFYKDDIVDWKVLGGGGPGYEMGTLRCKVRHVGMEVELDPLSWDDAHAFFVPRECTEEDWSEWVSHGVFVEPMWEERLTLVERAREARYIELVLRCKTNMTDLELDDFLGAASEMNFYGGDQPSAEYIPEGSHWREVDKYDPYVLLYLRRVSG